MNEKTLTVQDLCDLNDTFNFVPKRQIEVIAFIRFAKEELTFRQCLNSLLPAITKGVLVYHDQPNDSLLDITETLKIAQEFVQQNPGFKIFHYPHVVYAANDPIYLKEEGKDYFRENRLDVFYTFALDKAKEIATTDDPFVLKVDGDHIYDAKCISEQIDLINRCPISLDEVFLPKVNIVYLPSVDRLYFCSYVPVRDHFFAKANKLNFVLFKDFGRGYAYETQYPQTNPTFDVENIINNNKQVFDEFFATIHQRFDLFHEDSSDYNRQVSQTHRFVSNKQYLDKFKQLQDFFNSVKVADHFIYVDRVIPEYNSLHFLHQKRMEYPFGYELSLDEFVDFAHKQHWHYVEYQEWIKPSFPGHLTLENCNIVFPNSSDISSYLIADYDRIINIARSFYQK